MANLESDERYTLDGVKKLALAFARLKKWTLDVAACAVAHLAAKFFTKADNGLITAWWGDVVCNPPWSNIGPWLEKAWAEWHRSTHTHGPRVVRSITLILPSTRTDLDWWQKHVEPFRDKPGSPLRSLFLPDRQKYGEPGDLKGHNQGTPNFGTVVLVWRDW